MAAGHRIETYREFWPYYLREHAKSQTRAFHLIGTAVATISMLALFVSGNPWFLAVALVAGYGPAWGAHFFVERNHPATFRHPLWSLMSDYRMAWAWACGQLDSELDKAGIAHR